MPRAPRILLPGQPVHVFQRGHCRSSAFFRSDDYRRYLDVLGHASRRHGCAVHAYVLMTNHIHLLVTPRDELSIARTMQQLGASFVRPLNQRDGRSGSLWEGRFRAVLIDSERYFFVCSAYIEQNPVRAGMVEDPGDYRWSSFRFNAHGVPDPVITPHSLYVGLGTSSARRRAAYRDIFPADVIRPEYDAIRRATMSGSVLGSKAFQEKIEARVSRRLARLRHGGDRRSSRVRGSERSERARRAS